VVRVALAAIGHRLGSGLAVSTGSILLFLAINRLGRALVLSAHSDLAAAGR
jgi:hypothetical protein